MGHRQSRFATDDRKLIKLLESVMGNPSAASLYWSCHMSERLDAFSLPVDISVDSSCKMNHDELGGILQSALTKRLDDFCEYSKTSRFAPLLSAFALLMQHFGDSSNFYIHHNYGMNGTKDRQLRYPFTKVNHSTNSHDSFRDFCSQQHSSIQLSSYYLCIPKLPDDGNNEPIDKYLGVFLIDPSSGHTRDLIQDGLSQATLSLIVELLEDQTIVIRLNYDTSVISSSLVESIYHQFVFTLTQCIEFPDRDIRDIPTVPPDQEFSILSTFNSSDNIRIFPELKIPLHELIMARAHQVDPTTIALREISPSHRCLTYAELLQEASFLAKRILHQISRKPQSSNRTPNVAILLNRGIDQIITILAILMAGCAYVPIDPINHPPERIDYILRDSGAVCLVTNRTNVAVSNFFHAKIPVVDICENFQIHDRAERQLGLPTRSMSTTDLIAYVIYTSGSTGNPKGVSVPHIGIINDVFCVYEKFLSSDFSILSNVLFSTNICFDAHVDEVFLPLIFGGTITCCTQNISEIETLPSDLSFIQATPSVFQVITIPDSVKCVLIGGEKLTRNCLEKVIKPNRIVINGYGPTETTNESSLHIVSDVTDTKSIGRPIWNTQFYILDKHLGKYLVPKGAWGELFIGGIGVTKGYLNLPDLTSSVFVTSSASPHFPRDEIVYKTGDLVRINTVTNELEFKGRKNFGQQIKLRGYRIELGEIQYAIISSNRDLVVDCHVMVMDDQIVAFIVSKSNISYPLPYGGLPEYMKPSRVVKVREFPRNISGKLDAKQLAEFAKFDEQIGRMSDSDDPVVGTVIQGFLHAIPNPSNVGLTTNFFSVGGNSLNLVLLRNFLADKFGDKFEIRLQTLLQLQTVEKISNWIREELGGNTNSKKSSQIKPNFPAIIPLGSHTPGGPSYYCVHAAGGQVHTYTYLSDILTKHGANFFGIQDPSLTSCSLEYRRLSSFEAMGEFYADLIDTFHDSDREIFLGGHSSGGAIAFETAKHLRKKGRTVACLFLLDTDFGEDEDTEEIVETPGLSSVIERIDEIRHYLYNGWKEGLMHDYMQAVRRGSESGGFFSKLMGKTEPTANAWSLIQSVIPKSLGTQTASETTTSDLVQMISLLDHHLQIEKKYKPIGHSDVEIIQFTPRVSLDEAPTAPSTPKSSWSNLTTGKWKQIFVPDANHYNIIRPPAVGILSAVIADRMGLTVTDH